MNSPGPPKAWNRDERIAELTERIRLVPRRVSGRGREGQWHLKLRELFRERGQLYEAQGDYDSAIADYTEALETYGGGGVVQNGEYLFDLGSRANLHHMRGDYNGAIKDYSEMIEGHSNYFLAATRWWTAPYHKARGRAFAAKGDYINAIADFTKAARLDPKNVIAMSPRGELVHSKAQSFDAANPKWNRDNAVLLLASAYEEHGDLENAARCGRELLENSDLNEREFADGKRFAALC